MQLSRYTDFLVPQEAENRFLHLLNWNLVLDEGAEHLCYSLGSPVFDPVEVSKGTVAVLVRWSEPPHNMPNVPNSGTSSTFVSA